MAGWIPKDLFLESKCLYTRCHPQGRTPSLERCSVTQANAKKEPLEGIWLIERMVLDEGESVRMGPPWLTREREKPTGLIQFREYIYYLRLALEEWWKITPTHRGIEWRIWIRFVYASWASPTGPHSMDSHDTVSIWRHSVGSSHYVYLGGCHFTRCIQLGTIYTTMSVQYIMHQIWISILPLMPNRARTSRPIGKKSWQKPFFVFDGLNRTRPNRLRGAVY